MTARRFQPHGLGVGLVLGLVVSQRPLLLFLAGAVAGAIVTLLLVQSRRLARFLAARFSPPASVAPADGPTTAAAPPARHPLTPAEIADAWNEGRRQGTAAGIRAAARAEVRDHARRDAMRESLEHFAGELRGDALTRAIEPQSIRAELEERES